MPDFRVAETAPEHPKMRAAGPAALGLWAMAGAYSMNPSHLTDGWVPLHWVQSWPSGKKLAETLVKVGLWLREERAGIPGYRFHDWLETQRSASSIEDERRKARERMRAVRSGTVRPNKPRTYKGTDDERSPKVRDSLSLSQSPLGDLGREGHQSNARDRERPPTRCPEHANDDRPPPCGRCAGARRAAETWDTERAAATQAAVRGCPFCDADGRRWHPDGKRHGTVGPCDHQPPHRATG